jgi:CubicO group peptidase (beta-lactamase class C family)
VNRSQLHRLFAAAVLSLLVAAPALAQVARDPLAGLATHIEQARVLWKVPGVSVAVVKDQQVVFAEGFGVRSLESGGAVDADTLFAIGSNTKAFTATALGLLVQENKLSWDDPVLSYLPAFQMHDPLVTREITVRDLLCHRSGLGTFRGDLMTFGSIYDRAEVLRRIRFIEPSFDFRQGFGYSNLMFLTAGEIIPKVAGIGWDEFIAQRFFKPLGMTRSSTTLAALLAADNVATPHGLDGEAIVPIPHDSVDNMAPAGAINSSARDMAQWLLLQTGDGAFGGAQIVDPAVIAETRTPHNLQRVGAESQELNPWTHFSTYGLGWGLSDYRGRLLVSHGGGLNGMISLVALLPEEDLGVVVLSNFDTHGLTRSIVNHVLDAYLGGEQVDWDERYHGVIEALLEGRKAAAAAREEARLKGTSPSLPLESYVGRYTSSVYGDAEVTLEDGQLKLDPLAHPEISGTLAHWQLDTFLCRWTDRVWNESLVYFDLDDAGKVSQLRFAVRPDWIDTTEYVFVKQ